MKQRTSGDIINHAIPAADRERATTTTTTATVEPTQARLDKLWEVRNELEQVLLERRRELIVERDKATTAYDEGIYNLDQKLASIGAVPVVKVGSDSYASRQLTNKVIDILNEKPGEWMRTKELRRRLSTTAKISIVVADILRDGRIERFGRLSGSMYRVPLS